MEMLAVDLRYRHALDEVRRLAGDPLDVDAYLAELDSTPLSEAAAEAVEAHVMRRHDPSTRVR